MEWIQAELTAGYTLLVIEDNALDKYLMFPCASTYDRRVYLADYVGGALISKASECHLVGVSGVGNATQQLYMALHVTSWKAFTGSGAASTGSWRSGTGVGNTSLVSSLGQMTNRIDTGSRGSADRRAGRY